MELSLKKNKSSSLIFAPLILFILIFVTFVKIYALNISPLELSVDEAQYWHWSKKLDFGYFSKPPLIAWLISISTSIFGNEEWSVRIFSTIIHFLYRLFYGLLLMNYLSVSQALMRL